MKRRLIIALQVVIVLAGLVVIGLVYVDGSPDICIGYIPCVDNYTPHHHGLSRHR